MSITQLLGKIAQYIINPLLVLGFVVATIYFFYGIGEMIWKSGDEDLEKSKTNVKYGIVGLFIMFSVYGILRLVMNTLDIPCNNSMIFFC